MNDNESSKYTSIGELLLVAFIVLKLAHKIDWSWWRVLSPILIPAAAIAAVYIVAITVRGIVALVRIMTRSRKQ